MKVRTDFVTNSSSSSFIIARKEELTEEQKQIILDYVLKRFLTGSTEITQENMEEELEYINDRDGRKKQEVCKALEEGKKVYLGYVCHECDDYELDSLYQDLWEALEEASSESFKGIDTDLMY